jgi:RNA polymerase sigma factor (sigma-70 family)
MPEANTTVLNACLARLQAGDPAAREELFQRVCERLRRLTRKMLRDYARLQRWQETDDVFQVAMLKLHQNLQKHTPTSAQEFFQWSAKEIRRTLIDLSRHHFGPEGSAAHYATPLRLEKGDDSSPPEREKVEETNDPARLADWTALHEQIEVLPPQERTAFDLLWYHELTQEEAAEILGVDRRTVIRWWQSAKRELVQRMKGNLPGL